MKQEQRVVVSCIMVVCLLVIPAGIAVAEEGGPPEAIMKALDEPWTGDFDAIAERGVLRVLVSNSKTFYFLDGAQQRGATYDLFIEFEKWMNEKLKRSTMKFQVMFVPVTPEKMLPALLNGRGDVAAAYLAITPEGQKFVDFSDPLLTGVNEIVITGPNSPHMTTLDDLAGQEIFVRKSSSYYEHLLALNASFQQAGKTPIRLTPADEHLADEDLLEMVNAGLIPMTVVDSHIAEFWAQIFDKMTLHPDIAVDTGGEIAWAFRKNSPGLQKEFNAFIKEHKKGTLLGNMIFKRYLKSTKYVKNALEEGERQKFEAMVQFFEQYAGQYGFDFLMVAAQGYQESGLDQSVRSSAGAVGVMQLLPSTAADKSVGIPDIEDLEKNIHAGVKYMNFIYERYFGDAEMDMENKGLFCFASYNAGPNKIKKLRKQAEERGLDPNVWFNNVELIAAEVIGRETVHYVSNIYKYYIAYRLLVDQEAKKRAVLPKDMQQKLKEERAVQQATAPAKKAKALSQQEIRTLQERLTDLGYDPGPVDGRWGKKTEAALKQFQQDQGSAATGTLDDDTTKKLGL